jgi:hypothetical protein
VKHVTEWRSDRTAYHNGKKVQVDLNAAVKMFPTPTNSMMTIQDMEQARYAGNGKRPKYSALYPTPSACQGHNSGRIDEWGGSQNPFRGTAEGGGQLNPMWVEWLMGFPLGWTDLNV